MQKAFVSFLSSFPTCLRVLRVNHAIPYSILVRKRQNQNFWLKLIPSSRYRSWRSGAFRQKTYHQLYFHFFDVTKSRNRVSRSVLLQNLLLTFILGFKSHLRSSIKTLHVPFLSINHVNFMFSLKSFSLSYFAPN